MENASFIENPSVDEILDTEQCAYDYDDDRLWFNNEADERLFSSGGGSGYGTNAGVGCSYGGYYNRGGANVGVGFRSAYADLESVGL